jgi:hypothetical protein
MPESSTVIFEAATVTGSNTTMQFSLEGGTNIMSTVIKKRKTLSSGKGVGFV